MNGILMKPPLIKASLEGPKTQTRRVIKLPKWAEPDTMEIDIDDDGRDRMMAICKHTGCFAEVRPEYKPGQIVYIREKVVRHPDTDLAVYASDSEPVCDIERGNQFVYWEWSREWRSPLHLFAKHARYFIRILSVRPERLQSISEEDVAAEGVEFKGLYWGCGEARDKFQELWDSINAERGYPWSSNPWVWRNEYEMVSQDEAWR